jgi:hypothetical protein
MELLQRVIRALACLCDDWSVYDVIKRWIAFIALSFSEPDLTRKTLGESIKTFSPFISSFR